MDRFLTDLKHVVGNIFDRFVKQAARRYLLNATYRIDSTHEEAIAFKDEALWKYDPTIREHYYGFGCKFVDGPKTHDCPGVNTSEIGP